MGRRRHAFEAKARRGAQGTETLGLRAVAEHIGFLANLNLRRYDDRMLDPIESRSRTRSSPSATTRCDACGTYGDLRDSMGVCPARRKDCHGGLCQDCVLLNTKVSAGAKIRIKLYTIPRQYKTG